MTKVIVHDHLMGTGKSSRMIETINNAPEENRYIVVAPFLDECHRYAGTIPCEKSGDKKKPALDDRGKVIYTGKGCNASGREFHHPIAGYRNKVQDIERLVQEGRDIVTTHAALKMFTPETRQAIKDNGYTLVVDEELECVEQLRLRRERRLMLLNSGFVEEDDFGLLRWVAPDDLSSDDDEADIDGTGLSWEQRIKRMCKNGSLLLVPDDTGDRKLFMWEYPIEFMTAFDRVEVMTYMFEGSVFQKYLMCYGIPYEHQKGIMLPDNPFELINIVESDRMNRVGEREEAFSATHQKSFQKSHAIVESTRHNLINFFNNGTYGQAPMEERLWTCLKGGSSLLKGKGYTKRFVPHNIKAVNNFVDVSKVAYVYNPYMSPEIYKHLKRKGDEFTPDPIRYMLAEALQMIYRSRIRKDEPINLYIPSSRVRSGFIDWMSGKYT